MVARSSIIDIDPPSVYNHPISRIAMHVYCARFFQDAFTKITGHQPMCWQSRLFGEFCEGRIPAALDLPTGLGKTSVMAIWLIARAFAESQAGLPRRLIYVVDRRVVVDQATTEAEKIAAALTQDDPLVADLRQRIGLAGDRELLVSTLRGGRADDRAWTYDAAASAIVVGTIDMIGSRLLFSGYRMSRWSRSMQAGLIGVDTMIVLDEAHLSPAFDQVVRRVLDIRKAFASLPVPASVFLPLSATPWDLEPVNVFNLEAEDYNEPVVARRTGRLRPTKQLVFDALPDSKGALVEALADYAAQLDGKARAVLVYCTSREAANAVGNRLRKSLAQAGKRRDDDVGLVTGVRRGYERDRLVKQPTYLAFTYEDGERVVPEDGRTRFLVCTAAGEVGADLDAEAAIMDLVPLERMVQRLGRVNRRGACVQPAKVKVCYDPATLAVPASEKNEKKKAAAARLLATKNALDDLPRLEDGLDASPYSIGNIDPGRRAAGSTPPPPIPEIQQELVEAWALTSLENHPGRPEVGPFLRGDIDEEEPETTVAWRADVALLAQLPDRVVERALAAARLKPAEVLQAPAREVADVLQKRIKSLRKDWERAEEENELSDGSPSARLLVFRGGKLVGRGEITSEKAVLEPTLAAGNRSPARLDGDAVRVAQTLGNTTLLLEPAIGGLDDGGAFVDCAERQGLHVQPDIVIRRLWPSTANGEQKTRELIAAPAELREKYGHDALRNLDRNQYGLRRTWSAELPEATEDDDSPILEYWKSWDVDGETAASSRLQSLTEHHSWAKAEMADVAKRLGLPVSLSEALVRGIAVHDLGKDRPGWQNGVGAPRDGRPYAKSDRRGPGVRNYRHEFGSLRDVLYKDPHSLEGLDADLRELALHLIASHHGRARPSLIAGDEEEIFEDVLALDALEAARRYVRLQRIWGPWGLAWLEALFRSADATVSRRLDRDKAPLALTEIGAGE
jgi:CRISPR-associated endonuclease/helicase Cas3